MGSTLHPICPKPTKSCEKGPLKREPSKFYMKLFHSFSSLGSFRSSRTKAPTLCCKRRQLGSAVGVVDSVCRRRPLTPAFGSRKALIACDRSLSKWCSPMQDPLIPWSAADQKTLGTAANFCRSGARLAFKRCHLPGSLLILFC